MTRIAIALGGLADAILFAFGKRVGWALVLAWSLIQIPFIAPAPGASPTQQSFAALAFQQVTYVVSAGPAARRSGSSSGIGLATPLAGPGAWLEEGWRIDSYSEIGLGWVGIVLSIIAW